MSVTNNYLKIHILILSLLILFINTLQADAVKDSSKKITTEVSLSETQKPVIGKISFEEVLKKAKEHSYDLKIADYEVLISKQGVKGAFSEYFPKLNIGAGTEYTKNYRDIRETTVMSVGDAFINPYTRYQSVLGINVAYNLFDFGVRGENLKLAKEDVKLKELETKEKLQDMSLTLLDTYTKILITTKQIKANQEILALEENNLKLNERLYKAKEISKMDLNNSTVKVKQAKQRISELKSIRQESINWLSFYTGENYGEIVEVGTHDELLSHDGYYRKLYNAQMA